jgi:hypothetical protein
LVLLAFLAALLAAPPATASTNRFPDRSLAAAAADVPFGTWGGVITATDGERVTIYVSNVYPVDPTLTQRWADFLTSLVHGPELGLLTMYLAPSSDVTAYCGRGALACYDSNRDFLIAPPESNDPDLSAEAVVIHEYGHHIASHRSNAPWFAGAWGTKRWATYMGVCRKVRRHQLFPGAEQSLFYTLNPGEAFAETYRVLNQRLLGVAESPWTVVDDSLYPTQHALDLLRLDVTEPWRQTPARTLRVTAGRTYAVATPEDGTIVLHTAAHVKLSVFVSGTRVASGGSTLRYTICGARKLNVRATGAGSFRLSVTTP